MGQGHARTGAPAEMNHKHYEKFLKNYQGYLELCESLYRMPGNGEVPPGSPKKASGRRGCAG